ncbi:unnamed protein product [Rotaria socialis]|uniref:F-box domain-containing protein n=1 Tax=Rotaria socialis TaxID=392032 RepID=A0A818BVS7_9BILA|nr:unnamed protein product [Rotaria socialis]
MDRSNVTFLDLPDEILLIILKKLDNMDVLYSLLDVDNQRLDTIILDKAFTKTLNFVLTTIADDVLSIADSMLNRYCSNILPKIDHNVTSLILEAEAMERILLAADYPNLTELKLFNVIDYIVSHYFTEYRSSVVSNINNLPNMKCFSLECRCSTNQYDTHVLPLLRRMSNLEELSLNIINEKRTSCVDDTQINENILVHMPRLNKFTFYISTGTKLNHIVHHLSNHDIQRTFTNIGYQQICCFLNRISNGVICHAFSLPFAFDYLEYIGNTFPSMVFNHVIELAVHDILPFKHEFCMRITRCFPLLKIMRVLNSRPQLQLSHEFNSNDNQFHSIAEYPYLTSLSLLHSHTDYVEQFLNQTKTYLPRLTE